MHIAETEVFLMKCRLVVMVVFTAAVTVVLVEFVIISPHTRSVKNLLSPDIIMNSGISI